MRRVLILTGLLLVVGYLGLTLAEFADFRSIVLGDARAKSSISYRTDTGDTVELPWTQWVLTELPNGILARWALRKDVKVLWGLVYLLVSLGGGIIFLLLSQVPTGPSQSPPATLYSGRQSIARCASSAAAGVVSFFIVLWIGGTSLSPGLPKVSGVEHPIPFGRYLLLPVCAGLSVTRFFTYLDTNLERLLDAIFKAKTNNKEPKQ
jgi:hypothetical protein